MSLNFGAGVGGLTAALAFGCKGAQVDIVERNELILPRFRGNTQRYLHPHAYDWPDNSATQLEAGLPLMNWRAGLASDVVSQLSRGGTVESARMEDLRLHLSTSAKEIQSEACLVHCEGTRASSLLYDILILAVGVGTERSQFRRPTYWENDSLAQAFNVEVSSVLVSGNGDGALVDVIRASLLDFDHARLMTQFLASPEAYGLQAEISPSKVRRPETQVSILTRHIHHWN